MLESTARGEWGRDNERENQDTSSDTYTESICEVSTQEAFSDPSPPAQAGRGYLPGLSHNAMLIHLGWYSPYYVVIVQVPRTLWHLDVNICSPMDEGPWSCFYSYPVIGLSEEQAFWRLLGTARFLIVSSPNFLEPGLLQNGWFESLNGSSLEWLFVELLHLIGFSEETDERRRLWRTQTLSCQQEVPSPLRAERQEVQDFPFHGSSSVKWLLRLRSIFIWSRMIIRS